MSQELEAVGTISDLYIYPVKALGAIAVDKIEIDEHGPKYDRKWMLVRDGKFVSQRQHKELALVTSAIEGNRIKLSYPDKGSCSIPLEISAEKAVPNAKADLWGDELDILVNQKEASEWISGCIGKPMEFAYMCKSSMRQRNKPAGDFTVGFADGYPFLIANTASLEKIQGACDDEILMSRFRPNIVYRGKEAFEEKKWTKVKICSVEFPQLSECERCVVTTINQETGEKGKDPLKALRELSSEDGTMIFGTNMVSKGHGSIAIGEPVFAC